jgi:hypothetical protein
MTHKERMLAAIRGEACDCIPLAPRLDLWYTANKLADTLPREYTHASLEEIVDDLDVALHTIVPDFRDLSSSEDDIDRGLGIYSLHSMPYRNRLEGVHRRETVAGDKRIVEYDTPYGSVRTSFVYTKAMRNAGITISPVSEHVIKGEQDFQAVGYIFENAGVEPNYEGYARFQSLVGDRGLAAAFVNGSGSPMHLIQKELMPIEAFFYAIYDHPEALHKLAQQIGVYWSKVEAIVAECSCEIAFVGSNYDSTITHPPFFRQHILPSLSHFADTLHRRGKYLLTHTDGENTGLLQYYLDASVDIADSICPSPMTRLTFKEVRDAFAGRITIMGGIPSVCLLNDSMSELDFDAFLDKFLETIDEGDHLIVGISDTTPPAADFGRIRKICRKVKECGLTRQQATRWLEQAK